MYFSSDKIIMRSNTFIHEFLYCSFFVTCDVTWCTTDEVAEGGCARSRDDKCLIAFSAKYVCFDGASESCYCSVCLWLSSSFARFFPGYFCSYVTSLTFFRAHVFFLTCHNNRESTHCSGSCCCGLWSCMLISLLLFLSLSLSPSLSLSLPSVLTLTHLTCENNCQLITAPSL